MFNMHMAAPVGCLAAGKKNWDVVAELSGCSQGEIVEKGYAFP